MTTHSTDCTTTTTQWQYITQTLQQQQQQHELWFITQHVWDDESERGSDEPDLETFVEEDGEGKDLEEWVGLKGVGYHNVTKLTSQGNLINIAGLPNMPQNSVRIF